MINALFIISFFLSCNKEDLTQHKSATEYFPNTIGDYWEYNVYDSSYRLLDNPKLGRSYTVKVSIIGIKKLADSIDANVWQYAYPDTNIFKYIRITGDTVKTFTPPYYVSLSALAYPYPIFLIPFIAGNTWKSNLFNSDTYTSSLIPNIILNWQTYDSVFQISDHYLGPNLENYDTYWFKPNIGFLKIYFHDNSLGPIAIQLWQLKSYYLN